MVILTRAHDCGCAGVRPSGHYPARWPAHGSLCGSRVRATDRSRAAVSDLYSRAKSCPSRDPQTLPSSVATSTGDRIQTCNSPAASCAVRSSRRVRSVCGGLPCQHSDRPDSIDPILLNPYLRAKSRSSGVLRHLPDSNNLPIGAPGFEPGTSPTRTVRATRLRHAPTHAKYPTSRRLARLPTIAPPATLAECQRP
jgi:hypothetical protein